MGVKGLYSYCKQYRVPLYTQNIPCNKPLRIGFDGMSMLYNYKSRYEDMYPTLKELVSHGHKLIFVFDGKTPVEKEAEVKERRNVRDSAIQQANSLKDYLTADENIPSNERRVLEYSLARLEFKGWHITRDIRQKFQEVLKGMNIPYLKAVGEADNVLVDMARADKLDVVVSTDMDFLLSGVKRLWIPFRVTMYDGFEEIRLEELLKGEDITEEGLRDVGILCGVELLRGKLSIHTNMAFSWIRHYKSIETILESNVEEPQLEILRDKEVLAKVRQHFLAAEPWDIHIRPDHREYCKDFLDNL